MGNSVGLTSSSRFRGVVRREFSKDASVLLFSKFSSSGICVNLLPWMSLLLKFLVWIEIMR